jgi:hypothetical protein
MFFPAVFLLFVCTTVVASAAFFVLFLLTLGLIRSSSFFFVASLNGELVIISEACAVRFRPALLLVDTFGNGEICVTEILLLASAQQGDVSVDLHKSDREAMAGTVDVVCTWSVETAETVNVSEFEGS